MIQIIIKYLYFHIKICQIVNIIRIDKVGNNLVVTFDQDKKNKIIKPVSRRYYFIEEVCFRLCLM